MLTKRQLIEALVGVPDDTPICLPHEETGTVLDAHSVRRMTAVVVRGNHPPLFWCEATKAAADSRTVVVID